MKKKKYQTWEENQKKINLFIFDFMLYNDRLPNNSEIAQATGLSRQTVHKHIKNYSLGEKYIEDIETIRVMYSQVLAHVFKYALAGNMRAAKLFFQVTGGLNLINVKEQNNYLQINNVEANNEKKQLTNKPIEQIEQIEPAKLIEQEKRKL